MWYVLRCQQGREKKMADSYKENMDRSVLADVFMFTSDRMKRFGGQWHVKNIPMFPGYLFLETKDQKGLEMELKMYGKGSKGQKEDASLLQMYPEEEGFLRGLCGADHNLRMSKGVICQGVTYVTEGPLRGLESRIFKIDRHKRLARLTLPVRHWAGELAAGLEIFERK